MSEATVAPAPKKARKKLLGLPVPVVIGGAAALAALGYIWWRDRQAKKTGGTSGTTTGTTSSADLSAELAELQSELNELTGQGGGGGYGGTSTITSTSTKTPTSTSTTTKTGTATNPVKGLHITDTGYTSLTGEWNASKGAADYYVTVRQGSKIVQSSHVLGTIARVGNLKRKTAYEFRVRAQPGGTGGTDAKVTATTK
jgi:hypothetical protein